MSFTVPPFIAPPGSLLPRVWLQPYSPQIPVSGPVVWQFLVAFNNNTLDDPNAISTAAAPAGTLGGVNVWTDISQWVRSQASWLRGRQHELDRFETGSGSITLLDLDGRFDTWNTASPYAGLISMGRPFRIQATVAEGTFVLFTGHTKTWSTIWRQGLYAEMRLEFADGFAALALAALTNSQYASQVLTDGATHYWKLNEAAGASFVADSHPTGFIGTVRTGATGVQFGKTAGPKLFSADQAANFGQLVTAGNACWVDVTGAGFSGAGSWSVEFWVQITSPNAGQFWISQAATSGTANSWYVGLQATDYPLINARLYNNASTAVTVTGGGGTTIRSSSTDGNWHHVVLTYSGTTLKLYVDNYLDVFGTASLSSVALDQKKTTYIGSGSTPATLAIGGFNLSDVAFYSGVALTAGQVANHWKLGNGVDQGLSGTQINTVLDAISWPAAARNVDAGSTVMQLNQSNQAATRALAFLQRIEQSEQGALFMDVYGQPRWIARNNVLTNSRSRNVQAIFGDSSGEFPFEPDPELALDDLDLWNVASVQRNGGQQQIAQNTASVNQYGPHVFQASGLLHVSDLDSQGQAQWVVDHLAQPQTRLRKLKLRPAAVTGVAGMPAAVLSRELMDRIVVNRHNVPGGGTQFTQTALIERVEHTVDFQTGGDWQVTLGLSPTETKQYGIVGDATLGVVGTAIVGW